MYWAAILFYFILNPSIEGLGISSPIVG